MYTIRNTCLGHESAVALYIHDYICYTSASTKILSHFLRRKEYAHVINGLLLARPREIECWRTKYYRARVIIGFSKKYVKENGLAPDRIIIKMRKLSLNYFQIKPET